MQYYLAIDIGASSGRHIIGWLDGDKMITEEIYRFQNAPTQKENGLFWDVEFLYGEILNGLKKASEIGKIPKYVGIDTWGVDYALLDEDKKIIGDVFCYRDSRNERSAPAVHKVIPFSELYAKSGIQFSSFNTVYQLFSDKESGKLLSAKHFLMLPDYFNFRLTGVIKHEYTNATTTGMVNTKTHTWDGEIIERLGYNKALFGELSMPGSAVGVFTDEVSAFVGYTATVILPATHDTASAVLGAPLEKNSPYISSGTWSLLGVEEESAHTNDASREENYSNEGSVDFTFRLQKNIMGLWMIQEVRHEANDKYSFAELAEMASASSKKYSIDVNDTRFLAPKSMTDEICSAVGESLDIKDLAFVIYDNLARSYADAMAALERITGKKYTTLNIIGGGSKNSFLNALTAKYTKRRIITGPAECTAIGNLMMQMIGSEAISGVEEGRKIVKKSFDIKEFTEDL